MRREFRRQTQNDRSDKANKLAWRQSLSAQLRAAERSSCKDDLKKMFAEAAQNTAKLPVPDHQ